MPQPESMYSARGTIGPGLASGHCRHVGISLPVSVIFPDENDKMNLSVLDLARAGKDAAILAVSQFTLYGDARKGRRPAFVHAMEPVRANELYELYLLRLREKHGLRVETGVFRADMKVELVNDGPITILLDSKKQF